MIVAKEEAVEFARQHSSFNGNGTVEWLVRATPSSPLRSLIPFLKLFCHRATPETNPLTLRRRLTVCNDCNHIFPASRSGERCEICGSASVSNLGWRMAAPVERKNWLEMIGVSIPFFERWEAPRH